MGKVKRLFCWHQDFVHKGLSDPAPGLYICGKTLKNVYKIRIQRDLFETCNKWSSDKGFLLTSKVCPQGVFCPFPGAVYMYKIIKNVYEIRFRRDHFETCNKKRPSCCHKTFVPNGLSAPAWSYIHVKKKHIKMVKNQTSKRFFFKLATNGQSDKEFLLTSKFCPQGVVCPCPGAIYMYKII